jgi:hypothetical protein
MTRIARIFGDHPQIAQIHTDFYINLCKSGWRQRSRREATDTDGKAEWPSERERVSRSVDEGSPQRRQRRQSLLDRIDRILPE